LGGEARLSGTVLYLITSHKDPQQVHRLAATLRGGSPQASIVIHHDRSSTRIDLATFRDLGNLHILPFSVPVEWGDMSIVDMNLRSFEWVLDHLDFEWLVLLSGQDYPIKPVEEIESYLVDCPYDGLMEAPSEVVNRILREEKTRIRYSFTFRYFYRYFKLPRWPRYSSLPPRLRRSLKTALWKTLPRVQNLVFLHPMPPGARMRLGFRRMRTPFTADLRCYKASPWFSLRRRTVERLVASPRREPHLWRYYRRTVIPDESLFQTVLFNDPSFALHDDNLVYSRWTAASGSPEVLTREDLPDIRASGKHFARKFDLNVDPSVLDDLDGYLAARPTTAP
jgi:hypothetical protein